MADDKKTAPVPMVRYKVLAKCFVNGSLVDPSTHAEVMAPDGQEGKALKRIGPASASAVPKLPTVGG